MAAPPPLRLQQVSNGTKETRRDGRPLCTHGAVAEQCPLCAADAKTASDAGSAALAGVAVAMAALAAIPQSPRRMSLGPQPYVYSPPPPLENPQQPKKRPASVGPLPFAFVVGQPPLLPLRQYEERQAVSAAPLSCDECCAAEPATNAPPITPQQPAPKQQQQQKAAAASLTPKEKKKAELEQLKEEKRRKREEKEAKKRAEKEAKEAKKREEKEAKKRAHEEKKRRGSSGSKTAKKPEKQQQQRIRLAAGGGDPTAQQHHQHTSQQEQTATAVQTLVAMGFTENQVHRARLALERAKKRVTVDLLLDMLVADASMPQQQQHTAPEVSHSADTPSSPLSAEEHRPDASKSEPPPEPEPEAADSSALLPSAPPASKEACIVCFEHDVNAVLIPCGHLGLCMRCAEQIVAASGVCPVCRAPVASVVQVFRTAAC